jgi:TIR domain
MRAVFISYRRDDAEGEAGRLFADLAGKFGADKVFMDVTGIEPGRDFRKVIDRNVASCGVLLAIIGKGWIDAKDDAGRRRLDDPLDFVRLETASALKRDIPVIPVLVHGGRMPRAEQLPEDLTDLAYRNAVALTHARWDSDVQLLIKALHPLVGGMEKGSRGVEAEAAPDGASMDGAVPAPAADQARKPWRNVIIASVAAVVVAAGGLVAYEYGKVEETSVRQEAEETAAKRAASAKEAAAKEEAVKEAAAKEAAAREAAAREAAAREAAAREEAVKEAAAREAAAKKAAAKEAAAKDAAAREAAAKRAAAVHNDWAGLWTETLAKDSRCPPRLSLAQDGNQVHFFGRTVPIQNGSVSVSVQQGCAQQFQRPGYTYENPGTTTVSARLDGQGLVYTTDTTWNVPCDGHPAGKEHMECHYSRASTP